MKIIPYLSFILSASLIGCSSPPSGVLSSSADGKLFTKEETICLKRHEGAKPWDLKWAMTDYGWNDSRLFVTVHERTERFEPDYTAAVYASVGSQFKLVKRLDSWDEKNFLGSYFTKPDIVRVSVKGTGDRVQLIRFSQIMYGTGHYTTEHIFTPTPDLGIEEVEFVPAGRSFQANLGKDEDIWKSEFNTFTDEKLSFVFFIDKRGDANCCPSGGKVAGFYKLERKPDGRLKVSMDTFDREPIENGGTH